MFHIKNEILMKNKILDLIDFEKINLLLEGFNKSTGFVTAILDLKGNVLSKSGWRQICTDFHRINPETAKKCWISDTVLGNNVSDGRKYYFNKCLNGLIDVVVPIVINGEHIANLFTGQFFFEKPDVTFFRKQAADYGFDEKKYIEALDNVPVVSEEQVKTVMDFLLNITRLISETTFQKYEQEELNKALKKNERELTRLLESEKAALNEANKVKIQLSQILERINDGFGSLDRDWNYTYVNKKLAQNVGRNREDLLGHNIWAEFPEAIGTPVYQAYLRAMNEQITVELEHYFAPFGRWFQHRFYPSPDGLSVFSKDISERKLSEEKLRDNNSLIRIAAEKAKLGGWNVDLKENRSYWSDAVAAIHGMPPGFSPLVEDGINFYAPEWRDRIKKVFTECAKKGIPYDEEMEIINSSGKRVWIRTIGEAVKDEKGNIYKVEGAFQDISEKKIIEAKVREKDLQFRKLSANLPDLIFQFTRKPDGSYSVPVASEGIKNIFGCNPEDVANDFAPIAKVIHPDDAERVIADIEYSAEHMTYFTCEFRVLLPDKPVQWIFSRSTPEKLPDGSVTWYGFNANITYRRKIEDALSESENKFRKIYEDGPFGMALVNKDFKYIMANRKFCEIMDYTESELRSLTFMDITFPRDRNKGMKSVEQLIKGEIPVVRLEKRFVRKNGQIIWGSITVAANFDKNGDFLYNLAIIEDITQRKMADQEVKILNDKLKLLVEAIQELSVSSSMENIMKTVRIFARKLLNADGSTFVLRQEDTCYYADEDTISPLWKGKRFPISECITGWAMLNKKSVKINDIYSDERVPIEAYKSTYVRSLAVAPIRINNPLGAIGVYWGKNYDSTEMEMKLLQTLADAAAKAVENVQLIEGLEKRIVERTSQLQSINSELEAFSYSVSHDLRAPLRHINGFADILVRQFSGILPEDGMKHLNTIMESARKMGVLIDDLLNFSRTGRSELKKSNVKMNSIVSEVILQLEPSLTDRNIEWKIQKLPEVMVDYNLFMQVWTNLIENAVKYTQKVDQTVIGIDFTENGGEYIFSISDNGVGFDMQYSEKLFGVFQRLHTSSQFEGSGIGLANVKKIVLRHGGRIWANAEVNKGATFYFSVPKVTTW
jgi:PAS domain S-box-containing protein